MRVEIGPVRFQSATAWIGYGRTVLEHLARSDRPDAPSPALLGRFSELLDQFCRVDSQHGTFHWTAEMSPEEVEFLMKSLFEVGLMAESEHEADRLALRPAAADEFHFTLVRQILTQIEGEGPASAQFVEGIRAEWDVAGDG
ncbi:MAG: hypothetical protein R2698_03290 [Microthrixaceae bacterium]